MTGWPEASSRSFMVPHSAISPTTTSSLPLSPCKKRKITPQRRNLGFTSMDVLCGRGGLGNTHQGNRLFRRLVALNKKRYHRLASAHEKALLVDSIILTIQKNGGRFLQFNKNAGCWNQEVSHKKAAQKTGQAFREHGKGASASIAVKKVTQSDRASCKLLATPPSSSAASPKAFLTSPKDSDYPATSLVQLVMPIRRTDQSALHPPTSKIATDSGQGKPYNVDHANHKERQESIPSPPTSFDEVMHRQDSLGIYGTLQMPALSRETSLTLSRQESLGLSAALQMPDWDREISLSFMHNIMDV
jgi:hypothetical protein